LRKKGEAHY